MEVVVLPDHHAIARLVADAFVRLLTEKPDAVLGLATGSSPLAVYDELARRCAAGDVSFAQARAFALDEYVGLPAEHPQRYANVLDAELVGRVDLRTDAVATPDGLATDLPGACSRYEAEIRAAGGVDLQILGLGSDGHIAFNEPGSSLASRTRLKTLTQQTRRDNARFFGGEVDAVPQHCLTQGLGTIMEARHLVLVAMGEAKADAVQQVVEGAISATWPGSILQFHEHATVVLDEAAASRLHRTAYYREAFLNKPAWQGI